MKRAILFILLIITAFSSQAQALNDQAVWHYQTECGVSAIPCDIGYQKLEITGDTLIQGHTSKIVSKTNSKPVVNDTEYDKEYIYESNDSVYWFNRYAQEFTLLYDYGASQGDTWMIKVYDCTFQVVVDSVNFSTYSGTTMKNLYISDQHNYFSGKIIKGIGHTYSFFPRDIFAECKYNAAPDGQHINGLRCYEDDSVNFNFNDQPCDTTYVTTGVEERYSLDKYTLFPNPTNDKVNIKLDKTRQNIRLRLLTTTGQLIEQRQYENRQEIRYERNDLSPGLYLLELKTADQPAVTKKLLVK